MSHLEHIWHTWPDRQTRLSHSQQGGNIHLHQGCQIWLLNWVRLAQNGTNMGLLKIIFSIFWLGEPKYTKIDLKKSQFSPIWGQSDPIWMSNLTSLVHVWKLGDSPSKYYWIVTYLYTSIHYVTHINCLIAIVWYCDWSYSFTHQCFYTYT